MTAATLAAIAVAISTWGQPPCQPNVIWTNAQPRVAEAVWTTDYSSCEIRFNRREARRMRDHDWPMYCTSMVHEWGHLMGHDHSTNPHSVMYPNLTHVFKGCKR